MSISRPTKLDFIIALAIIIVCYTLFKIGLFDTNIIAGGKEYFKPNLNKVNEGIITAKYLDKHNHNYKTIEIKLDNENEFYYILRGAYDDRFYTYIEINDSLIKMEYGNEIIVRRNSIDSLFKLDIDGYK